MGKTNIRSRQIFDGGVKRDDINVTETGQAVVAKVTTGTGLTQTSSGVDTGTGDVEVSLDNPVSIANGGTGETSRQNAIDSLTNVSSAGTGYVLTKDSSGNATFSELSAENAIDPGYINGLHLEYIDSSSVKCGAGICRDVLDTFNIEVTSDITADLDNSGAGGLDTGTKAANTMYCIIVIADSTGTNNTALMLSTSKTGSPTMPSGYDKYRRTCAIVTDSSSNILKFISWGTGKHRTLYYDTTLNDTQVLNGGNSTTYQSIDLSDFIPPCSELCMIHITWLPDDNDNTFYLRPTGSTIDESNQQISVTVGVGSSTSRMEINHRIHTSESQSIDYKVTDTSDSVSISIVSYEGEI